MIGAKLLVLSCSSRFATVGHRLKRRTSELWKSERGVVAIYMGLTLPVFVGGIALGAEMGHLYWLQRELQHAADMATHAAATRRLYGDNDAEQKLAAQQVMLSSGIKKTVSTFTLNSPPKTGNYVTPSPQWAIEGVFSYVYPRLFSSIFSDTPYVISARSVVISRANGTACVLATNPSKQGAVSVIGSASVVVDGCWVAANSDATDASDFVGTKGALTADCVRAVGSVDDGATTVKRGVETSQLNTDCDAPLEYAPHIEDPYANRTPPSHPKSCNEEGADGSTIGGVTLHCRDWSPLNGVTGVHLFRNNAKMTINGTDRISSGEDGVTFYFEDESSPQINGGAEIDFKAPIKDHFPTKGMLFWAAVGNTQDMKINGNSDSSLSGAIYSPSGKIIWLGSGSEWGCVQLVADQVEFSGNAATKISCPSGTPNGGTGIPTVTKVTLVE